MIFAFFALFSASIWLAILLMPWRPWSTREFLDSAGSCAQGDLSEITVLIPARNEREYIEATLSGLNAQGDGLNVILIDDQSTDGTKETAQKAAGKRFHVISGKPLPSDWNGKLWALEQGRQVVKTPLTLLIDADIELESGILVALQMMMKQNDLSFISLMAAMHMTNFWEKLLMPAFIYFFKLLYPFRLSNSRFSKVAAAAGGCILLETRLLNEIGGFGSICKELIDDCALARKIQSRGYRTWIGLTHSVRSLRVYENLGTIWNMVARTAFTQLHYSVLMLMLCTATLFAAFCLPLVSLMFGTSIDRYFAVIALCGMVLSYIPTLRFYNVPKWWALTMPVVGTLYLTMTWTSAIRYWLGQRSQWKGRTYKR